MTTLHHSAPGWLLHLEGHPAPPPRRPPAQTVATRAAQLRALDELMAPFRAPRPVVDLSPLPALPRRY